MSSVVGGKYLIHSEIAEGTYGRVYLATDQKTGKQYAIKEYLKKSLSYIPQLAQFIHSEIKIMHHVSHSHQNIVTLYEHIETEDSHHLVMEYCQKGQLEDIYDPCRTFPESKCLKYFSQMALAIQKLHSLNVVHRDIQLSNICLTESDDIRICDFGLAQFFDPSSRITGFRGSSLYALPDSLLGKEYHPSELDIWGLGCCLYKILTGYLPFRGCEQAVNGQFMIPLHELDISEQSKDLLRGILCADPAKRLNLDQILMHPWLIGFMVGEDARECP
jgi:serine/threonine protein kinase